MHCLFCAGFFVFSFFVKILLRAIDWVIIERFCYVLVLIASSGVFASSSAAQAGFGSLAFSNLKQTLVLQPRDESYTLAHNGREIVVRLGNRLVVKTRSDINAVELKKLDVGIEKVQQLAQLSNANIWLITLQHMNLQRAMKVLQQDERVIYAQPDLLQTRQSAQHKNAENAETVSRVVLEQKSFKKKVRLAIIDDGFNFDHPEFSDTNLVLEYDADQRVQSASPKSGLDQHGTLVAGVIAAAADEKGIDGLAPDVELIAIRQVSSWTSDMVLAFSVARMMKTEVVNSSWVLPFLPEPLFDLLTDWMQEQQPYLVFAAGNNQRDACDVNALSELKGIWLIGAADQKGQPLPYSNYGSCVSFYAPAQFMSTAAQGAYKPFTGTSAATAYVSGLIARELASGNKPDMAFIKTFLF
jgi:subtilisin